MEDRGAGSQSETNKSVQKDRRQIKHELSGKEKKKFRQKAKVMKKKRGSLGIMITPYC
jgi:hypothetical protein